MFLRRLLLAVELKRTAGFLDKERRQHGDEKISGKRKSRRSWSGAERLSCVAAVLSILFFGGILFWNLSGLRDSQLDSHVAIVAQSHDVEWESVSSENQSDGQLQLNKQRILKKGTVELLFPTGVRAVVSAPATFKITGSNQIFLSQGILLAEVRTEEAKGFTVETPTSKNIDHGTVFGVVVNHGGESIMQVFQGEVSSYNTRSGVFNKAGQDNLLTVHDRIFHKHDGASSRRIQNFSENFCAIFGNPSLNFSSGVGAVDTSFPRKNNDSNSIPNSIAGHSNPGAANSKGSLMLSRIKDLVGVTSTPSPAKARKAKREMINLVAAEKLEDRVLLSAVTIQENDFERFSNVGTPFSAFPGENNFQFVSGFRHPTVSSAATTSTFDTPGNLYGNRTARFELRANDLTNTQGDEGFRSEMGPQMPGKGKLSMWDFDVFTYEFSTFVPSYNEWDRSADPEYTDVIAQWWPVPDNSIESAVGRTPTALSIKGNKFVFTISGDKPTNTDGTTDNANELTQFVHQHEVGYVSIQQWVQWKIEVKWSPDDELNGNPHPNQGFLKVYSKVQQSDNTFPASWTERLSYNGTTAYHDAKIPYFKFGLYRWRWSGNVANDGGAVSKRVIHFDNIKVTRDQNALHAAGDEVTNGNAAELQNQELSKAAREATRRWQLAGADVSGLRDLTISIGNLGGNLLGQATGSSVVIDSNAAGYGWYVDRNMRTDSEFQRYRKPAGMDLLTVVMHEFGHVLGYDHDDPNDGIATLMDHTLDVGERHSPDGFQSNENIVTDARKGWWKRFRRSARSVNA